jgi:hypothetical protein
MPLGSDPEGTFGFVATEAPVPVAANGLPLLASEPNGWLVGSKAGKDIVELPITIPEGPKDTTVPDMVYAIPPIVKVFDPPTIISVGLADMDWPPVTVVI